MSEKKRIEEERFKGPKKKGLIEFMSEKNGFKKKGLIYNNKCTPFICLLKVIITTSVHTT